MECGGRAKRRTAFKSRGAAGAINPLLRPSGRTPTMSEPYREILEGQALQRSAPGTRHELICGRLHDCVKASVANFTSTRLLGRRAEIKLSSHTTVCPDLSLVVAATGKLWLAAEIVSPDDHRADTVVKKQIYEDAKLPRLWMVDPRYDNVEIYHGTEYGLVLKGILAGREVLTEKLLPEFELAVAELFRAA
jgi:Uma2 family endonuclease